jgi:prepilin-type N-terminal cleavage/methylation domain-containing protein
MPSSDRSLQYGFTLIELLLVIALVLIISIPASSFYTRFINQMAVRDAREGLVGMFQEAQALSLSGKKNSSWGVRYEPSEIVLFRGDSFQDRDPAFDQTLDINSNVNISGFQETVFSRSSGHPDQAHPSIMIYWGNDQESFSLNSEGAIE